MMDQWPSQALPAGWRRLPRQGEGEGGQWLAERRRARGSPALHQFQLQAKLLRSVLTPNAALLKFQGSANLTVDQVYAAPRSASPPTGCN